MRIAIVGSGIAGLGSARLLQRQGHAVTLFEAGPTLGGHTAHRRRHARRRHRAGGHRLPGVQRPHLSAPDRAVRRAGRGERRQRDVVLGARRRAPARMGRHRPRVAVRAAVATRCGRPSGGCSPTSCASTARRRAMLAAGTRAGRSRSATTSTRGRYCAPFRDWYLLPMAAAIWSSPEAGHPRLPAADVRPLLPQPRPAADRRPAAVAHRGRRRRASTCARIAAALPDVRVGTPVDAGAAQRARRRRRPPAARTERFDEVVLACHSDQALRAARRPVAARSARLLGDGPLPAQPRACCTPTPRLLPRSRRAWSAWNYLAVADAGGDAARSPSATSSTSCSRCRSARR